MTVGYSLVNNTKKEQIIFLHLPVNTMGEILSNPLSAYIVKWYKAQHHNDNVDFVSDTYDDWPFINGSRSDLKHYKEVTNKVVDSLIAQGIILDKGIVWRDDDDPDTVFIRDLSLVSAPK
ncbi:hypothetical protein ACJJIW_01375 [Microbulbifer sp. JMSA004]|uniref:hypothetical protein n=1 Tax=Microbulbifer sp. JMSA004 TaxID=3243370 RepID=UPI0040390536